MPGLIFLFIYNFSMVCVSFHIHAQEGDSPESMDSGLDSSSGSTSSIRSAIADRSGEFFNFEDIPQRTHEN